MKSLSTLPVVLLSLLSCLSVAFASPIPARSTEHVEKRMNRVGPAVANAAKTTLQRANTLPAIAAPKQHLALPHPPHPPVKLSNFVHKVIEHSGHKDYNGVHPAKALEGVVKGAYINRNDLKKVTVTDPQHIGGHGGGNHPPDMRNHVGIKEHPVSGKPSPKKHLDVGNALPPIDTKHFAAVSSRPKPPGRSNTI